MKRSIQRRLLGSTLLIFLVAWLVILKISVSASEGRFLERVDRELAIDAAYLIDAFHALERRAPPIPEPPSGSPAESTNPESGEDAPAFRQSIPELELLIGRRADRLFRLWVDGELITRTDDALPTEPFADASGSAGYFSFRGDLGDETSEVGWQYWRFCRLVDEDAGVVVLAGADLQKLAAYVDGLLWHFFWPLFASLPIALLALIVGIRFSLRPLADVSREIQRRQVDDLRPLDLENPPREIAPLIEAIEDLLARLGRAFEAEKRFTADASHELRTPLASLKVNAQLLKRESPELAEHPSLVGLLEGIDRATRLVEQLLTLARLEPEVAATTSPPLPIEPRLTACVERLAPRVLERGLDFELHCEAGASVYASPGAFEILVGNLLANALHYGKEGGRVIVDARRRGEDIYLSIENEGDPIPAAERERLFDRFYRPAGSPGLGAGLGLAIARRAAEVHGGTVEITEAEAFRGVRVLVRLPAAEEN